MRAKELESRETKESEWSQERNERIGIEPEEKQKNRNGARREMKESEWSQERILLRDDGKNLGSKRWRCFLPT